MECLNGYKNYRLLFVDDDQVVSRWMEEFLGTYFQEVYCACGGDEAWEIYQNKTIDLIITDIQMPKISGIDLIQKIRKDDSKKPIIILSAHTDKEYLMQGIDLNIQSFIIKPINITKLCEALKKVKEFENITGIVEKVNLYSGVTFEAYNSQLIGTDNSVIKLNKKEKMLLELLLKNRDKTVSYEMIEKYIWNNHWEVMSECALRTIVKNLRKKVGKESIENISGYGYKIKTQN